MVGACRQLEIRSPCLRCTPQSQPSFSMGLKAVVSSLHAAVCHANAFVGFVNVMDKRTYEDCLMSANIKHPYYFPLDECQCPESF